MPQKLSIDLELNSQNYKQGAQQATGATEDLKKATDDYLKDYGSLRKQFAATKREAQNLAGAFASLSAAEKNSEFGKEIKAQMDIAIEKAAEFQDVMSDTQQAIKNASSDTQTWDAFKQGFDIAKSAAMTYASAIAKVTGNEEDLAKLVKTLTMLENGFNTVIKVGNALQQQSAIMTGIRKVQMLAAARAEEIGTAATVKATIAQKAFNLVAKANPYVLLASGILAAVTAIATYISLTKDSKKAQEEEAKATELQTKAFDAYKNSMTKSVVPFKKLRAEWKSLRTEAEKVQWIKDNKTELDKLGITINNVNDAERILVENTQAIVKAFKLKAEAAAKAAVAQSLYIEQIQEEQDMLKKMNDINLKYDKKIAGTKDIVGTSKEQQIDILNQQRDVELANLAYESKEKRKEQEERINKLLKDNVDLEQRSANILSKVNGKKQDKSTEETTSKEKTDKKKVKFETGVELSDKVSKLIIQDLNKKVKDINKKSEAGIEKVKVDMKLSEDSLNLSDLGNTLAKIAKAEEVPVELDFEIPDNMSDEIDKERTHLDHLTEALITAETAKIEFAKAGDTEGVAAMTEEIARLTKECDKSAISLENSLSKAEKIANISKGFEDAGRAVGSFGDMFSALGDATDDAGLKVMGIIAQAIATVTLSFAQALTTCKTWVDWLIFGVTGMSTMISMIAQIKNLTSGSYAQGGIIPGNSYSGDRLIASVNSGEMILNNRQQSRLLDIANGIISPANGNYIVNVQGKIKGTDIVLVSKNTSKILSKSSTNIYF